MSKDCGDSHEQHFLAAKVSFLSEQNTSTLFALSLKDSNNQQFARFGLLIANLSIFAIINQEVCYQLLEGPTKSSDKSAWFPLLGFKF